MVRVDFHICPKIVTFAKKISDIIKYYMAVRIVGVDLPQNKRGEIALTYIFGKDHPGESRRGCEHQGSGLDRRTGREGS